MLVLWIAGACPLLCGVRAHAEPDGSAPRDCCDHDRRNTAPQTPSAPSTPPPAPCFCSGHGVTPERTETIHVDHSAPFTARPQDAHDGLCDSGRSVNAADGLRSVPPGEQRVLPLLI